jgi:hypothetical protein
VTFKEERLTLYVNAIPNDRYVTLDELIRPLEVEVAANREERRGEHYLTIAYNQGAARVAALLEMRADKLLQGIPALVVFLRHPCSGPCLEILTPRASRVVYGVLG